MFSFVFDWLNLVVVLVDDFINLYKLVMFECLICILCMVGFDSLLVNIIDKGDVESVLLNVS